jgi:probable HAF family extracellular repeat protein
MRAMLWQNGELVDLGSLGLSPAAINDRGTMVGWMVPTNGTTEQGQAFIRENGTVRRLNTGNRKGHPSAINNSGRVVGYAQTPENGNYACIWNGDEILDLNDLVGIKSGWRLVIARAINDRGQILARAVKGKQQQDCLLSPLKLLPLLEEEAATAPAAREKPAAAIVPFNLTSFERLPGGAFRLAFAGKPDGKYVIMASTNLAAWTVLGPAANNGGQVEFTDGEAAKFTMRFYRAALAP